MKIAVAGKGGVGKTLIAAYLASYFSRKYRCVIAIDADSSPNLGITLGLSPERMRAITPLSENKILIEQKTGTTYTGVYRLMFSVNDIIRDYAMKTPLGPELIIIGTVRSMGGGCACAANTLVRNLLRHLIVEREEVVVMDMEAGIEHMGRGTAEHVDILLMVTDANRKSLETTRSIVTLARDHIPRRYVVANRINGAGQETVVRNFCQDLGVQILGIIPHDQDIVDAEVQGESPLTLQNSPALSALKTIGSLIEGIDV
jgi:CO dehydrogenase maturation factor